MSAEQMQSFVFDKGANDEDICLRCAIIMEKSIVERCKNHVELRRLREVGYDV